ncbi:MAG: undecaprenyl-phosphate glucose phosphotransferase [Labrys sp. (in: a-proteobacteria)]
MSSTDVRAKFGSPAILGSLDHDRAGASEGPAILSAEAIEVARRFTENAISPAILLGMIRLIEFLALLAIGLIIYVGYVEPESGFNISYLLPLTAGALLAMLFIQAADGYSIGSLRSIARQMGRVIAAWTLVFATFAVAMFFLKMGEEYSRVWFAGWYLGGLGFLLVFRFGVALAIRQWNRDGRLQRRAVVVGGGEPAAELIHSIEGASDSDIQICGVFDDRADDRSPAIVKGYPKLGTISELVEFARLAKIDLLIVSLPLTAENRLLQILKKLWVLPVDIRLSAHSNKLRFRPRSYSYIGSVPFIDVFDKPITDWDSIIKRLFDLFFGTLILLMVSPIMIATAIAIKLDSKGPVFFRQKRYGFNNEAIEVWKFRSLYAEMSDFSAAKLVTKDDPRVTRVGRFIRKTSIDELPQLFNVLVGTLSLVGPRPHAVTAKMADRLYEQVCDGYFARHKVKPGITGWAQINGWRGETDTQEKIRMRIEFDLHYIENWSPFFDLQILVLTPFSLLNNENAY